MTTPQRRADHGFTLVEILIAIVLVGILSAVVVVGVGSLTSKGSGAACAASKDAARTGATVYFASNGSQPTTISAMTTATPPALTLPSGVTIDASGLVAAGSGWQLVMLAGSGATPPTFACSSEFATGMATGPNGHLYLFVAGNAQAAAAAAAAGNVSIGGRTGYLATITSQAEHDFVVGLLTGGSAWVGGSDAAAEGVWIFTQGPETGTQFSAGSTPVGGRYTRWFAGEPNGSTTENCLHLYAAVGHMWNDAACTWTGSSGYVVEVGG